MGAALMAVQTHRMTSAWLEMYAYSALYPLWLFHEMTRALHDRTDQA